MFKKAKPFFLICETPLHAGSGNDLGIVDLPIQRERPTNYPKIEASSLKGSIREDFEQQVEIKKSLEASDATKDSGYYWANSNNVTRLQSFFNITPGENVKSSAVSLAFGPDGGELHAGALGFTDARILLFPVKSMKGVFAWITCDRVLQRFKSDLSLAYPQLNLPELPEARRMHGESNVKFKDIDGTNDAKVILEEYTLQLTKDEKCKGFAKWLAQQIFPLQKSEEAAVNNYWRDKMAKDILVLSDDDFNDFISLSTEVITRIKINPATGTVQNGALFTEEYLPAESVLYALALASPIFANRDQSKGIFAANGQTEEERVIEFFTRGHSEVIQIGANATLGKGLTRIQTIEATVI